MDLRTLEATVLDTLHKQNRLLQYPEIVAVNALLLVLELALQREGDLSEFVGGINQALRWAQTECPETADISITNGAEFRQDAFDLVKWGIDYGKIKTRHAASERDIARGAIDVAQKVVRFESPEALSIYSYAPLAEEQLFKEQRKIGEAALLEVTREWMIRTEWHRETSFVFDPSFIPSAPSFQKVKDWIDSVVLPELPATTKISSYSLGDFRHFVAAVHALAYGVQCFAMLSRLEGASPISAAALIFSESEMLQRLERATGMEKSVVAAIATDMTVNPSAATLIHAYPFVKTKDGHMILSAAVFGSTNLQKIAASAITRMSAAGAKSYSAAQEGIEIVRTAEVTEQLRRRGYHVQPGIKVVGKKPDFLIWDEVTSTIIVMDYKNFLPVVDSRSYLNRRVGLQKGISQVRKYVDLLRSAPDDLSEVLGWDVSGHSIHGVLLLRLPMSIPHVHDSEVLVTDWQRLVEAMGPQANTEELLAQLPKPVLLEPTTEELKVAEWTYTLLGLA